MSGPGSKTGGYHCPCPQLDQFWEEVQRSGWSQTTELLDHMDRCHHWLKDVRAGGADDCPPVPVQVLENSLKHRTTGIFKDLFESNQWSVLLHECPVGSVQQDLKGLLLLASIRYGLGDFTLNILGLVADSLVMEAIRFAVHLQDKSIFLQMFRGCPRSRRVFKQKFVFQQWKKRQQPDCPPYGNKPGEVSWMYRTLYKAGEKDLALLVAGNNPHDDRLIKHFCLNERTRFDTKQKMYRCALRKLFSKPNQSNHPVTIVSAIWADQGRSRADRSYIFRQAVRQETHAILCALPELTRIFKRDLKFFTSWYLLENADYANFFIICTRFGKEDIEWLERFGIKSAVETYFRDKPDASLKTFTEQFPLDSDTPFFRTLFRKAIEKSVQSDCVEGYVQLCKTRCKFLATSVTEFKEDDLKSAYLSAIDKRHFIQEVCTRKIAYGMLEDTSLNEILILLNIVVEKRVWNVLPVLHHGLTHLYVSKKLLPKLLENCVFKMLSDQSTWPGMAPALEQWIKQEAVEVFPHLVDPMKAVLLAEHWPYSVSTVKQWCLDNGRVYLAFFLALVTADWTLVKAVVTSLDSLEVHHRTLMAALMLASTRGALSTCVAMLKASPVKTGVLDIRLFVKEKDRLVIACEEHGLLDWAMVLQCHDLNYIKQHLHSYHNQTVLNWIMQTVVDYEKWDIAKELITRCTDSELLEIVLRKAMIRGHEDIAKALIVNMNPLTYFDYGTLLEVVVNSHPPEKRIKMVSLCVASGLSTFQRHIQRQRPVCLLWNLQWSERDGHLDVVKALLGSGTCSYSSLYAIANNEQLQTRFTNSERETEDWKQGYREICQAAATPCRLEHKARLVVSHSLGCQPGRAARINSLSLPPGLKDRMSFKDILEPLKEK